MCNHNASHNLQGPRGKPGPKGEKGEQGNNVSAYYINPTNTFKII